MPASKRGAAASPRSRTSRDPRRPRPRSTLPRSSLRREDAAGTRRSSSACRPPCRRPHPHGAMTRETQSPRAPAAPSCAGQWGLPANSGASASAWFAIASARCRHAVASAKAVRSPRRPKRRERSLVFTSDHQKALQPPNCAAPGFEQGAVQRARYKGCWCRLMMMIPRIATSTLVVTAIAIAMACGTAPPRDMSVRGPAPTRPSPGAARGSGPSPHRTRLVQTRGLLRGERALVPGFQRRWDRRSAGLVSRLDYLKELGIDALWLMPDLSIGLQGLGLRHRRLPDDRSRLRRRRGVRSTSQRGARAQDACVPRSRAQSHVRSTRAFKESRSSKTNPKADWYLWSDTASRADLGDCKPDNPRFGNLWTKDEPRGQFFYHRFYPEQPDLNYRTPTS